MIENLIREEASCTEVTGIPFHPYQCCQTALCPNCPGLRRQHGELYNGVPAEHDPEDKDSENFDWAIITYRKHEYHQCCLLHQGCINNKKGCKGKFPTCLALPVVEQARKPPKSTLDPVLKCKPISQFRDEVQLTINKKLQKHYLLWRDLGKSFCKKHCLPIEMLALQFPEHHNDINSCEWLCRSDSVLL